MISRVDVIYSPICEKIPFVRLIAQKYGLELYEYNISEIDDECDQIPNYVADKIKEIYSGKDGFYAWYIFFNGKPAPDFEERFPTEYIPDTPEENTDIISDFAVEELSVEFINSDFFAQEQVGPGILCLSHLTNKQLAKKNNFTEIRIKRRQYAEKVIAKQGVFGITLSLNKQIIGFVTFMPQKMARLAGFYGGELDESTVNKTLTLCCLFVPKKYRSKGIATRLLQETIKWAKGAQYLYIEAVVKEKNYGWECEWWSIHPFSKLGFNKIKRVKYHDGYPNMWLLGLELEKSDGSK